MRNFRKVLFRNLILFLTGYCIYVAIEVTYRGFSYRLMGIVGGLALMVLSALSTTIMKGRQLPLQMLVGALIITFFEMTSGLFALKFLHVRMWDYSGQWMSLCSGFICPLFSLFWFFLSGVGIIITDSWNYYVMHGDTRPQYKVFRWSFTLPERFCEKSAA